MANADDIKTEIERRMKAECPETVYPHGETQVTMIHPPMKIEGIYASMFAQIIKYSGEMGINPKLLIEFIWKSGISRTNTLFSSVIMRKKV